MDTRANGIDQSPERRPGVPMETEPRPAGAAHWDEPERMLEPDRGKVLRRANLEEMTPVYSTANPPRGLSGAMRRAAYKIPEHKTSHWLVLLLADRVDAIEHGRPWLIPLALLMFAGGAATALVLRMRRSFARRAFVSA